MHPCYGCPWYSKRCLNPRAKRKFLAICKEMVAKMQEEIFGAKN